MTMSSELVEKYWKIVHLPRGYMAFDKDGKCMMILYQSESVRIIVMRRPDAPNVYYVKVEVLKVTNNLGMGWLAHSNQSMHAELSDIILNSLSDMPDFLLDEIT
jgi:hypothetical protein